MKNFINWSQNVICTPKAWLYPKSIEEIQQIIIDNIGINKIRVVGSGHSFTPLVACNDIIVSLDNYQGIIHVDKQNKTVKVKAGTKLKYLGELLFQHQLAQENLGDINVQSIAGALSTGTHGTGIQFGTLSTQIVGIEFINGNGTIINCSEIENSEIFKAAQISLGTLGIITALTLRLEDTYVLEFHSKKENINTVFQELNSYNENTRNFEFYWFPYTNIAQTKFNNISNKNPVENKFGDWFDNFMENTLYGFLSAFTIYKPSLAQPLSKLSAALVSTTSKVNYSHKVYALPRSVLFNEMEYNIPYEMFETVKTACIKAFNQKKFNIHFPTENRFVAADNIWLSPANERKSAYIAFHAYKGQDYTSYFETMENICRNYGGRPHWGKMHNCTSNDLQNMYPHWNKFIEIKNKMDPKKVFETPYLKKLFD